MVDYRALFIDAASGDVLDEPPLTFDSPISLKAGETGSFSAHMPVDHPMATHANIENGDREITVLRDDVPICNGPFDWSVDSATRQLNLTVYEASAYFDQMVVEADLAYNEDRFDWVRDVWTVLTTKTSTAGDGTASPGLTINAGFPNFNVSSGTSGFTLNSSLSGAGFYTFRDVLNKLAENPDEGIEWRMDYGTGSTRMTCQRTLKLGAPLGSTLDVQVTDWNTLSYTRSGSQIRALTRAHVRGSGITATKQNTGSITAGFILREGVLDRGTITDATELADVAREFRRTGQPPVKAITASYVPGRMLPFGWAQLGDTVPFEVNDVAELLDITASNRRVVQIDIQPPSGTSPELVTLTLNIPLSDLGA